VNYRCAAAALAALLAAGPAAALDFSQVDRHIGREPAYKTKPLYCLALIGLTGQTRVWLVLDGDRLYVDKNCNGDLTDDGPPAGLTDERDYFDKVNVSPDGGKTVYSFDVSLWNRPALRDPHQEPFNQIVQVTFTDGRRFGASGDQVKPLFFAAKPQETPVMHFGGDLRMGFAVRQPLRKVHDGNRLSVSVGTPGSCDGAWVHLLHLTIPKQFQPQAVLELPPAKPDDVSARVQLVLRERCCGCLFHEVVAEKFGPGRVKVTLSFADWRDGRVADATYEIDTPTPKNR
jgi:hypothetical protein